VWFAYDSQGRSEGIGSRYFTVLNGSFDSRPDGTALAQDKSFDSRPDGTALAQDKSFDSRPDRTALAQDKSFDGVPAARGVSAAAAETALRDAPAQARGEARALDTLAPATDGVWGRAGFDVRAPYAELIGDDAGVRRVRIRDLGRLELWLGAVDRGYLIANGTLRDLPPGSRLDIATGVFTWSPGLGYVGTYRLAFVRGGEQILVDVTIGPMAPAADGASEIRMSVDMPRSGESVSVGFIVAGWALDPQSWTGSGIDAVHVWAQRTDAAAVAPQFLGAAALGGWRPDVAHAYGAMFGAAGFSLTTGELAPGQYDLTVFVWNRRTARWEDARTVRVTIR
jgi:hypothetical protein